MKLDVKSTGTLQLAFNVRLQSDGALHQFHLHPPSQAISQRKYQKLDGQTSVIIYFKTLMLVRI